MIPIANASPNGDRDDSLPLGVPSAKTSSDGARDGSLPLGVPSAKTSSDGARDGSLPLGVPSAKTSSDGARDGSLPLGVPFARTSLFAFQPRVVRALAARGVRGALESPATTVALFVFYLLTGYFFTAPLYIVGQASIKGMTDFVPILLCFLIPALTMGLLSEELKSGTFETLATMPLEDWDIVLGKYLGFAGMHLIAIAGLGFYALALQALVQPPLALDWGETLGTLLSFALTGLLYGAIGLFTSSFSKSQIISFVGAFLLCFLFIIMSKFALYAPGWLGACLEQLGIDAHSDTLAKGVLDTRDLLYFASLSFLFLYMTVRRLQTRRF